MMFAMPASPIVAVLDTNVVIAGLLWEGPPRSLLARATEGDDFILATSPILIDELVGTLSLPRFRKRMAEAGKSAEALVVVYRDATTPRVVHDDIDDDHVIAAAVAARARYIVTGDRAHLLPIGMHGDIAIISPRQCLDLLGS